MGKPLLIQQARDFSNSLIGIPKGTSRGLQKAQLTDLASFDLVGQIQEGFDNVPGYFGSEVRHRGKVDNLRSGVKEGAKGFAYGLADGLSGLVTEPYKGAREGVSLQRYARRADTAGYRWRHQWHYHRQ